jgi:hypothetical protein
MDSMHAFIQCLTCSSYTVVRQKVVINRTHLEVVRDAIHLVIASRKPQGAVVRRGDHHVERIPICTLVFGHVCAVSSSGVYQPVRGEQNGSTTKADQDD